MIAKLLGRRSASKAAKVAEAEAQIESTIKGGVRTLLGKLSTRVEVQSRNGSDYLSLYMGSTDEETGLSTGLFLLTDRYYGLPQEDAAFQVEERWLTHSFGMGKIACRFVQEISPGNLVVSEMKWERDGDQVRRSLNVSGVPLTQLFELGSDFSIAFAGYSDHGAYALEAKKPGITDVEDFFGTINTPDVIDGLQAISPSAPILYAGTNQHLENNPWK